MERECLICKGHDFSVVFTEFDVDILCCRSCGHVCSAYEGETHYDGYFGYESIAKGTHHWWDIAHRKMYDHFGSIFLSGNGGRLLDVGCGLGFFVKRCQQWPKWKAHGCEISEQAVKFGSEELGLPNLKSGLVEEAGYEKGSFDIITLWDVIEHLKEPDGLLSHLAALLKDDGLLFIHTPNAPMQLMKARLKVALKGMQDGAHYLEAKDHLHLYQMATMEKLLQRTGFPNVRFTHLWPIQSVAGSKGKLALLAKNSWYLFSRMVFGLTLGLCNINNNLFVIGRKK